MDTNLCRGQQICDQALLYADVNDSALQRLRLSVVKFLRIKTPLSHCTVYIQAFITDIVALTNRTLRYFEHRMTRLLSTANHDVSRCVILTS